ncbi:MAG: hypothetical protein Q8K67_02315 [Geothrix sp.]|nr:hypothetical protein [Geothrix sp.]
MSDADVLRAVEQMEAWLREPEALPDAEALAAWNRELQSAVAGAERGPGWADLAIRARTLGKQAQGRAATLAVQRDQVRAELDAQGRGGRALKGYGAAAR